MKKKLTITSLIKFIIIFITLSALVIIFSENTNIAQRYTENFIYKSVYLFHNSLDVIFGVIDRLVPIFPSKIRILWWQPIVISLELIFFISLFLTFLFNLISSNKKISNKYKTVAYLLIFIYSIFLIIPVKTITNNYINQFIRKTRFDLYRPWMPKTVWMGGDPEFNNEYTRYRYSWNQNNIPEKASITVSCLGHYRLSVNGQRVYHGPVFAVEPNVYSDQVPIEEYINLGPNQIEIDCVFVDGITHEYSQYSQSAVLVGGSIKDGIWRHTLADYRLWEYSKLESIEPIERLFNAGWVEKYDLTKRLSYLSVSYIPNTSYVAQERPTPLLKYRSVNLKKVSSKYPVYDLSEFRLGYLSITGSQNNSCDMEIHYGAELDADGFPKNYMSQIDKLKLSKGDVSWEQISRRAGRYIGFKGNCDNEALDIKFSEVYREFNHPVPPVGLTQEDQDIFDIALRSLQVNVQDQFEDSVERERAMYIGDSIAVSECLLPFKDNYFLVRQAINISAQNQNEDGSFPSMSPSGRDQLIPEYAIMWPKWLNMYFKESNDLEFIEEMWPHLEALMNWAEENSSEEGFFYNKNKNEKWWNFIDWTPVDKTYPFITSQQIWYLESLEAASFLAKSTDHEDTIYQQKANNLRKRLQEKAVNEKGLFVDSFSSSGEKSGTGLVTNALAGRMALFSSQEKSREALDYFNQLDPYTYSPYSQTWVIEWAIKANNKELGLSLLRNYWGGMVAEGSISIYERYHPMKDVKDVYDSYSHAWGCGPVWLFKELSY